MRADGKIAASIDELIAPFASGQSSNIGDDIAEWNLVCARELPGSQSLDIDDALTQLDEMSKRVGSEIRRNYHRFLLNPAEGEFSQAKYCVLMMVTVLQQDFGVQYNPDRIRNPDFRDAGDLFIHGMLGGNGGTCASMPVLYVAIGRRLGWPIKLVHTLSHVFCRWDDAEGRHPFGKERFNIEATGRGTIFFPDDYFRMWPEPLTDEMIAKFGCLKSLSPAEELAQFLVMRGHCLEDNGWIGKACDAYKAACQLVRSDLIYRAFWQHAENVRELLIERDTLLDYFGPDVPLPIGYFPRHVLRQIRSEIRSADCEFVSPFYQLARQQAEAVMQGQMQAAMQHVRPSVGPIAHRPIANPQIPNHVNTWNWHIGIAAPDIPTPLTHAHAFPSVPTLPGVMGANSPFAAVPNNFGTTLSAKLLGTVDPQKLAMRRQEAVAIAKSLPNGVVLKQPNRILLAPPIQPQTIQQSSQTEI